MQLLSLNTLFPSRIKPRYLAWFSILLFSLQIITGTNLLFALLVMLFILISGFTINLLGGMRNLAGFCVAMMALKIVIVSQIAKVFFLQPGDSLLDEPIVTMSVLVLGITSVCLAAIATRKIKFRRVVLVPTMDPRKLLAMAIVSFAIGITASLYVQFFGFDSITGAINVGGLVGIARQSGIFLPLSVVLATAFTIVNSGAKTSMSLFAAIPLVTYFLFGLFGATKFGMLDPVVLYALTCIAFQFRFTRKHLLAFAAFIVFSTTVLFPLAQFGKGVRSEFAVENFDRIIDLISDQFSSVSSIEEASSSLNAVSSDNYRFLYYGRPTGFLDRFSLIEPVDELVNVTLQEGTLGWETVTYGFRMVLPRFLYPGKPIYNTANILGHRAGYLAPEDWTTQVSFGVIAESFAAFSWVGVIFIPFVLMTVFFVVYRGLVGPIESNIWAIPLFGILQHSFVEATIASMTLLVTQSALILVASYFVVNWISQWIMPFLGAVGRRTIGPLSESA